jgi:hypothetical protein
LNVLLPLPLASSTRRISLKSLAGVRFNILCTDRINVVKCSS